MRAVTIDSDLATLFTFTPRKPPKTTILEVPPFDLYLECCSGASGSTRSRARACIIMMQDSCGVD